MDTLICAAMLAVAATVVSAVVASQVRAVRRHLTGGES